MARMSRSDAQPNVCAGAGKASRSVIVAAAGSSSVPGVITNSTAGTLGFPSNRIATPDVNNASRA